MSAHRTAEELVAAGYVDVHQLPMTWADCWREWPPHLVASLGVDPTDPWYSAEYEPDGSGPRHWFIASPSDSYAVEDLLQAVRPAVVSGGNWERDPSIARQVLRDFFAMTDDEQRDLIGKHGKRA